MIDQFLIYLSLILVGGLVVLLLGYANRRRETTIRHPRPVVVVFKDPFGLASGFQYTLNPNHRRRRVFGNMDFIAEAGRETPPEHRSFEMEDGKQGDTLSVTWALRDGSEITDTTVLPTSSVSSVTVSLEKTGAIRFE